MSIFLWSVKMCSSAPNNIERNSFNVATMESNSFSIVVYVVYLCTSKFLTEKRHRYSILHYVKTQVNNHLHLYIFDKVCCDLGMPYVKLHPKLVNVSFFEGEFHFWGPFYFALFFNPERSVNGLRACARLRHKSL